MQLRAPLSQRAIIVPVLRLAWPVVVEQVLGMSVGLINTYLVGHLGAAPLAAMGLSVQLSSLLIGFFSAVGVGSTALVARHIGADEPDEAVRLGGQSLLLAVVVGLLTALPCIFGGGALLTVLGGAEDVVTLGRSYLLAVGTTMPLMALLFIGNAVLRGAGDTRTPMLVMALVNLVNVTVSSMLVYGVGPLPALGVLGAGIGSAAGSGVGGLAVVALLLRGHSKAGLQITLASMRLEPQRVWRLLRIGMPAGAEQVLMRLGQILVAAAVTQLGTAAYAGHQLGIQLLSIAFMPGFAFSVAATTLVGQELGRNAPQSTQSHPETSPLTRCEAYVYAACWMAVAIMCSIGAATFVFNEPLLRVFTTDLEVIAQGRYAMQGAALIQLPLAWYYVLSGALRGAGDTRFVLISQSAPIWLVRIPLAPRLGIALGLGLPGVWIGMILDVVCRAALLLLRFRSRAWALLQV